jgi:hypothetical protein
MPEERGVPFGGGKTNRGALLIKMQPRKEFLFARLTNWST